MMMIDTQTITKDIQTMIGAYLHMEEDKIDLNVSVYNNANLENIEVLVQSKNYGCVRRVSHYDLLHSRSKYIEIFALIIKPMVDEILSKERGSEQVSSFTVGEEQEILKLKDRVSKHSFRIVNKLGMYSQTNQQPHMGSIIIAGGCFASWFHNEELHDIDVFYLAEHSTNYAAYNYINTLKSKDPNVIKDHEKYLRNNKMIEKVYTEKESTTMFDYQHIFTKYNTRKELIDHFDFAHATISYNVGENKLYITRKAFDALRTKTLVRNKKENNIVEWRVQKFLDRGWTKDKNFDKEAGDFFVDAVNTPLGTFPSVSASSYQSSTDKLLQRMAAQALGS